MGSVLDGTMGGKALVIMLLLFEAVDEDDGAAASFDCIHINTDESHRRRPSGQWSASLPEVDSSCLKGWCLFFLAVEKGVMGAFGKSKLRCGSFSMSFLESERCD